MRNHPARTAFTLLELIIVMLIVAVLVALALPAIQHVRERMRMGSCQNNLRQLGLAIQNYHSAFKQVPDLYNGGYWPRPFTQNELFLSHSWRTAVLPQLERTALFESMRYDLAATSPENQVAINVEVPVFVCPSTSTPNMTVPELPLWKDANGNFRDPAGTAARTDYAAIVGMNRPDAYWNEADFGCWAEPQFLKDGQLTHGHRRFADITDGLSNTILVGERAGRPDQHVAGEPVVPYSVLVSNSMSTSEAAWAVSAHPQETVLWHDYGVNFTNNRGLFSFHSGGANILLADGSVRLLGTSTDLDTLRSLVTRAGHD